MRLQTIVALTDFSTAAEHALDRAALLAAEHKARLHLLFGAEQPDPKFVDPQARLEQRARQLARRHDLPVKALAYRGAGVVDEVLRAAVGADLLVLDKRAHQGVEQLWRGGTLSQILRRSPCPVLVVQRAAREAYAHVLLAVDRQISRKRRRAGRIPEPCRLARPHRRAPGGAARAGRFSRFRRHPQPLAQEGLIP